MLQFTIVLEPALEQGVCSITDSWSYLSSIWRSWWSPWRCQSLGSKAAFCKKVGAKLKEWSSQSLHDAPNGAGKQSEEHMGFKIFQNNRAIEPVKRCIGQDVRDVPRRLLPLRYQEWMEEWPYSEQAVFPDNPQQISTEWCICMWTVELLQSHLLNLVSKSKILELQRPERLAGWSQRRGWVSPTYQVADSCGVSVH
jgi:hypothetical protein